MAQPIFGRKFAEDEMTMLEWFVERPRPSTTVSERQSLWSPQQHHVDQLRELLDLMDTFSSNDQRARFLLSSNWMRDHGADACAAHRDDRPRGLSDPRSSTGIRRETPVSHLSEESAMPAAHEERQVHVSTTSVECPPWCTKEHDVDLLDMSGVHGCTFDIQDVTIGATQGFGNDDDGTPVVDEIQICAESSESHIEDLTREECLQMASALLEAVNKVDALIAEVA